MSSKNTVQKTTYYPRVYNAFHLNVYRKECFHHHNSHHYILTYCLFPTHGKDGKNILLGHTVIHSSFSVIVGIEVYNCITYKTKKKVKGNQKELDWSHLSPRNVVCSPCRCSSSWNSQRLKVREIMEGP